MREAIITWTVISTFTQTWLDKPKWFKILIASICLLSTSCELNEPITQEIDAFQNKFAANALDITLPVTNVFIDSVRADEANRFLLGTLNDPIFGKINSRVFTNIDFFSGILPDSTATLDSAVLELFETDFYAFGEAPSSFMVDLQVDLLDDTLFNLSTNSENVIYFSDSDIGVLESPVGEGSFEYRPESDSILRIRLTEFYSNGLLNTVQNTSVDDIDFGRFIGYRISVTNNIPGIFRIDPTSLQSRVRVYFSETNVDDTTTFELNFTNQARFNQYNIDRTESVLSNIPDEGGIFDLNNDKIYFQSGSGIYPFIDLSGLKALSDTINNIIVQNATFSVGIDGEVPDEEVMLGEPENVRYFLSNNQGLFDGGGSINDPIQNLVLDDASYINPGVRRAIIHNLNEETGEYSGNITLFIQSFLNDSFENKSGLVMVPSDVTSLNRIILNKNAINLRIIYTSLVP